MDGLLTDTETLHLKSYMAALEKCGLPITAEFYAEYWIRKGFSTNQFLEMRGSDLDPEFVKHEKAKIYDELVKTELKTMPGAGEIVRRFHGRLKMAVGSASLRKNVVGALEQLGLCSYMDAVVSVEDVENRKPAPDIFLAAARAIGVKPEHCIVLEDARKGLIAAERAGMRCLIIPNEYTAGSDFTEATGVFKNLAAAAEWIEAHI